MRYLVYKRKYLYKYEKALLDKNMFLGKFKKSYRKEKSLRRNYITLIKKKEFV